MLPQRPKHAGRSAISVANTSTPLRCVQDENFPLARDLQELGGVRNPAERRATRTNTGQAMPRIVTATINPAIDKSTTVGQVVPERKLRCKPPRLEPGGGGINVARAIHRLGGQATALWSQGGPAGQRFLELLNEEAIPHQPIPIAGPTRENLIVYEESSEQQYRFGMPGPELDQQELNRWIEAIDRMDPPPDYFVASGSLPPGAPADLYARMADRLGPDCRTIVDAKGVALREAVQRGVYLIKPNVRELAGLTGQDADEGQAVERQAKSLVENQKVQVVVVSLGRGGALLVTADVVRHFRSPTVPIRSKVGAGDSMLAGIVLSLARNETVDQAVAFGVAAGTAAVMTPGTELCRREQTETLHREMMSDQMAADKPPDIEGLRL
jgi:6-phosphofructokinase 2